MSPMMACSTAGWKWLLVDVLLAATVVVFVAISHFQVISPKKTGYFCDDQSIKFPYQGDTVPIRLLLTVNLIVPLISVVIVEKLHTSAFSLSLNNNFKPCLKRVGKVYMDYILGQTFCIFLAEIIKNLVSEHRPHFLSTCRPNVTHCQNEFIINYVCTSTEPISRINDSFKSFPSSHAVSAFFASVFLMLYIHIRGRTLVSHLLRPWLQVLVLTWAFYCGLSRITDHRHHWWDVCAGGVIGSLFAVATVGMLSNWFHTKADIVISTVEEAQPEKRISTRRLISSSSSDQKEMDVVNSKTLESNHL